MKFNFKNFLVKLGGGHTAEAYKAVEKERDTAKKDCEDLAVKVANLQNEKSELVVEKGNLKSKVDNLEQDIENYKKETHFEAKDNIVVRHKVVTMKKNIITYCAYNDDGRQLYSKVNFAFQRYDNKIAYSFDFNSWNIYKVNGEEFEFGKSKVMAERINELIEAQKDILIEEIR